LVLRLCDCFCLGTAMAEAGYRTPPGIELRSPVPSDLDAMTQLTITAFGTGEDRDLDVVRGRAAHLLACAHPCSVVAERPSGQLVGVAITRHIGRIVLLAWAAVHPAHQGQGVLRAMLTDWPARQRDTTRIVVSSTDPRAMRAYAQLGLHVLPTVSAGGILRPGAVCAPHRGASYAPDEVAGLLAQLGDDVRGAQYPLADAALMHAQGDCAHVVDDATGRAAVIRNDGIIRLAVATTPAAASSALRHALAAVPSGATVHLNHLRAGMDWAIHEALAAGLALSPEAPVYADAPLNPLHLPNGTLG
jgi:GNAT superfamily N-acetyltransferase